MRGTPALWMEISVDRLLLLGPRGSKNTRKIATGVMISEDSLEQMEDIDPLITSLMSE